MYTYCTSTHFYKIVCGGEKLILVDSTSFHLPVSMDVHINNTQFSNKTSHTYVKHILHIRKQKKNLFSVFQ